MKKEFASHFPAPKRNNEDLVYGIQPILEAFSSGKTIDKILLQKGSDNPVLKEIQSKAQTLQVPVVQVPIEKLNRMTTKNHQGVVALVAAVDFTPLHNIIPTLFEKGETPLLLVLDRITDMRNFGAIVRTAECAGVHGIVIPNKESAQVGSDAMRTSAGALHHIPISKEKNLKQTIKYLQESGLQVIGCTEKAEKIIYEIDFNLPTALVMGSEEDGLSQEVMQSVDFLAKIPMRGKVGSLNVSVATGVVLFEVQRQRESKILIRT
ncbi:MAG: 23S rRNA (guanosine(2251)-2'-O)-methyltransferase RlmB [Flammeovirgaceae bacterium]